MVIRDAATEASKGRVWYVTGDSGKEYVVQFVRMNHQQRWICSCPDFLFRKFAAKRHCKHLHAVRERIGERQVA